MRKHTVMCLKSLNTKPLMTERAVEYARTVLNNEQDKQASTFLWRYRFVMLRYERVYLGCFSEFLCRCSRYLRMVS